VKIKLNILLALEPNAQVSSTCFRSLSSSPALRKKKSRALFSTHTLTLHGFSSWNLKTHRDGGKSCLLHCIALVYIHPTCTNYGTCLPTPSTWLTSPSTNYGWCKTTNYSTRDGLLPYLLQFQDWAAELTIYLPLTALARRKRRTSRLCLTYPASTWTDDANAHLHPFSPKLTDLGTN
jgi:hypothetical protein